MLDWALNWLLTPVLAASNSKAFFLIIHPIISGLKHNLNLLKGSFISWRPLSGGWGIPLGNFSEGIVPSVVNFKRFFSLRVSYN